MADDKQTLADLDKRMDELAASGDLAALGALVAPDFIYTHSTGQSQTRDEWFASNAQNAGKFKRLVTDVEVEVHGDVAVTRGNLDIVRDDGPVLMRYVRVHRLKDGKWQAISNRTVRAVDRQSQ
jgi:ketosteroid isomerase-like protein